MIGQIILRGLSFYKYINCITKDNTNVQQRQRETQDLKNLYWPCEGKVPDSELRSLYWLYVLEFILPLPGIKVGIDRLLAGMVKAFLLSPIMLENKVIKMYYKLNRINWNYYLKFITSGTARKAHILISTTCSFKMHDLPKLFW